MTPRLLLPFSDDSTLFFAQAMAGLLRPLGARAVLALVAGGAGLSDRQLAAGLPAGPELRLDPGAFTAPGALAGIDAVITSRMIPPILRMLGQGADGAPCPALPDRPRVVAFQGGLDFTPERSFAHRRRADAVFLVPRRDIGRYLAQRRAEGLGPQLVDFGHPAFLRPAAWHPGAPPRPPAGATDITFFAQAISPPTRAGRAHLVAVLAALARRHPGRRVVLKLRHLPGENRGHLHRERLPYPDLVAALPDRPANLVLDAAPMAEVLGRTALGLTCTSTAAADLVRAGVPAQIYLDFVETYLDPLVPPMRQLFGASGLVVSLGELLAGTARPPDPAWLDDMFCPRDLGERVLAAVAAVSQAKHIM